MWETAGARWGEYESKVAATVYTSNRGRERREQVPIGQRAYAGLRCSLGGECPVTGIIADAQFSSTAVVRAGVPAAGVVGGEQLLGLSKRPFAGGRFR